MAEAVALGDRDMAGKHDEHAGAGLAGLEQPLAVAVFPDLAEPAHARDLERGQFRKRLLGTGKHPRPRSATIRLVSSRAVHAHFGLTFVGR